MASQVANKAKYLVATKVIDFANDTFKVILMASGFVFNRDSHHGYADVSGQELTTGNGYTAGGVALTGVAVTENDTTDRTEVTWNNSSVTASGGSLVASGAILYDDTVASPTADPIMCYIDFGGDQTINDGQTFTLTGIKFYLS